MPARRLLSRYLPHAIFFLSCAAIMVIELVASRLVAQHLGSSLYTWTAVIGVMLAGISVGNAIGGRLADRYRPERVLPWLFRLAGVATLAALGLNALFANLRPWTGLGWPARILLSVIAIFILPAMALGTLSPSLGKMAVERGRRVGAALGGFYAWGTVGSIAGTFLTGFWLLFAFGNRVTILGCAALLIVLAAVVAMGGRRAEGSQAMVGPARRVGPDEGGRLAEAPLPPHQPEALVPAVSAAPVETGSFSTTPLTGRTPGRLGEASLPWRWRYTPHAIAFFASACVMVVELLASRIIADQAGNSLYTWTSVIGVVLAGMSLGSYIGGALSDRISPERFVGWMFLAASLSCAAILVLAYVSSVNTPFKGWLWPALVFSTVASIFFVPSLLLGTFTPAVTKLAVQRSTVVGTTLGSVSAWSAAGSILGTVASGFWLVAALGTRSLTMLVALLLAAAGAVLGPRRAVHAAWSAVVLAALVLTRVDVGFVSSWQHAEILRPPPSDAFEADSAYQHIRVYDSVSEDDPDRKLRVLALDFLIHGYTDLRDPAYLNYDYERIYRDVALRYAGDKKRVSVFFLGGGSYTFPRWVTKQWPGSVPVVAEIDPMVVEANHRALGLPRDTRIRTMVGDARNVVDDLPAARQFDFFFGDAFNDLSVPYHLTTVEFAQSVAARLRPDGAYLVNVIDSFHSGLLLGSFYKTLRQVFRHVYIFCTEKEGVGQRRDTFVVAASNVPLDTTGWEAGHDGDFEGSLLTRANLVELLLKSRGRILTDDNAPVENLLAPVVKMRVKNDE